MPTAFVIRFRDPSRWRIFGPLAVVHRHMLERQVANQFEIDLPFGCDLIEVG